MHSYPLSHVHAKAFTCSAAALLLSRRRAAGVGLGVTGVHVACSAAHWPVHTGVGLSVGAAVGLTVGFAVGVAVGAAVGLVVGVAVGVTVGAAVGLVVAAVHILLSLSRSLGGLHSVQLSMLVLPSVNVKEASNGHSSHPF